MYQFSNSNFFRQNKMNKSGNWWCWNLEVEVVVVVVKIEKEEEEVFCK